MTHKRTSLLMLGSLIAILAPSAWAQNVNGSLTGVIKDASGGIISAATVSARNLGTSAEFSGRSDETGTYWIRNLPLGNYDVTVEANGFSHYETRGVQLQVNEVVRLDVTLSVGGTAEKVTVHAQALSVDTTSGVLKEVVDQKRIEELPLNGRNAAQLMRLVVGVYINQNAGFIATVTSGSTYPGVTPVSINGNRGNTTNYILDGASNNDAYNNLPGALPNPDALQEFSVQTNSFSAEFGRQSGGVVNAVTKSGTNEFHGSAFEFVRNQALNAANWFAPIVNGQKQGDGLKRNQFGATAGGPVFIPKLYDGRNKTFFFVSFQETTLRQNPVQTSILVGSAAERTGNFSELKKQLVDPITRQPLPGNIIPPSEISPISQYVLSKVPTPVSGTTITAAPPNRNDDRQVLVRGDQRFGDRNTLTGRYFRSWTETTPFLNPSNYLEVTTGGNWLSETISISDNHVISPTMMNQALFSVSRNHSVFTPEQPDKSLPSLGVKIYNLPNYYWGFAVSGYFTLSTGNTNSFLRDEYQGLDTVRWTRGKHQMSFGGEYGHASLGIRDNVASSGSFTFNGSAPFTGDSLADFLTGHFNDVTQYLGTIQQARAHRVGFFFDDTIKVNHRLTLDLGVRWEPFFPYTDELHQLAVLRPGAKSSLYVNAPTGVLFTGDPGVPAGLVPTVWRNFGPRIGLAWDVFGDGKTAIRGGYGVFYDAPNLISLVNQPTQAPFLPKVQTFGNAVNSLADPYAGTVNPFPGSSTPSPNAVFPQFSSQFLDAPDYRNPYVQSWNATVERQLVGGFVARASYAGSKGTRLAVPREFNPATYVPGATTATTNNRRPYAPAMGSTVLLESTGNSTFHSLQLTLEKRFAHGFSILSNYQFSKSLDDASANKGTTIVRGDPRNYHLDKAVSDYNRPNVLNFSGLWEMPIRPTSRWIRFAIGGWNLNAIVSGISGVPFSIYSGVDNALSGIPNQRADIIGDPFFSGSRSNDQVVSQYLNKAAFAPNALNTYGNLARNTFTSPATVTADLGLSKTFPITERIRTIFRFETFNALNRVNFGIPNNTQNSAVFLRITSAGDPRILQLALRTIW